MSSYGQDLRKTQYSGLRETCKAKTKLRSNCATHFCYCTTQFALFKLYKFHTNHCTRIHDMQQIDSHTHTHCKISSH